MFILHGDRRSQQFAGFSVDGVLYGKLNAQQLILLAAATLDKLETMAAYSSTRVLTAGSE